MTISLKILGKELAQAGIRHGGYNIDGVVWDVDGTTEIQNREDVATVIAAHDPEPEPAYEEFAKPVKAPAGYFEDIYIASPKPKTNPKDALAEAVAESKKGDGQNKSIALIVMDLLFYIEDLETRLAAVEIKTK